MPFVDHELVVTLMGAERAELVVGTALALGLLDERDDRLVLHALVEEFLVRRARAETQVEAAEAFPTAWAYYTAQKEPDAAFDLAHRLGVPSDIDRLLIDTMDELLNSARLPTLETWASRAVRLVGETPAVLVAQAEIALRRGRHLTAQALADRAARPTRVPKRRPVPRVSCRGACRTHRPARRRCPCPCTSVPRPSARATISAGLRCGGG